MNSRLPGLFALAAVAVLIDRNETPFACRNSAAPASEDAT